MKTRSRTTGRNPWLPFGATLSVAGLLFAMAACSPSDEMYAPNDPLSNTTPAALKGIANAPSESGAFVIRYSMEGILAYTLVDPKTQLVLTTNYPDRLPTYCGGDFPTDVVSVQEIIAGNNEWRHILRAGGEVRAKVFQGLFIWDNNLAEFCDFIANAPLLAEGMVSINYHDNDFNGAYQPNRAASFGFNIQGKLTTPGGETKSLSAVSTYLWPRDESGSSILDFLKSVSVQLH